MSFQNMAARDHMTSLRHGKPVAETDIYDTDQGAWPRDSFDQQPN
jgi:hypothetical protein